MGRDTIQLENTVSTISQEYLLEFTFEYGIPDGLHPELPGLEETIMDFSEGKVGVYTKFFEFANFRIPISQFLFDILGWMSFSKRPGKNTPQCYTKPLDSLKNWNNQFFWVDERIFPTIMDWRTNALKDGIPAANSYSAADAVILNTHHIDLFNLISAQNPTKVKTAARLVRPLMVPLLTVTANHVIDMEDAAMASESSETPSTIEKSPLDFANEDPPQIITKRGGTEDKVQDDLAYKIPLTRNASTTGVALEIGLEEEVAAMGPLVNKRRRKRGNNEEEANAPPKVLRMDHDASLPTQSTHGGKYLASMRLDASSLLSMPAAQDPSTAMKSVSDPEPLSYAKPHSSSKGTATEIPTEDVATAEFNVQFSEGSPESGRSTSVPSVVGSPGSIYQPGWGMTNDCRLDTPDACQDVVDHIVPLGYFSKLRHLPNADFFNQYNINLARQVAMGSQIRLRFEQKVRLLKKARSKIARRDQRIQVREEEIKKLDQELQSLRAVESEVHDLQNQKKNLKTLLEAEVDMKKAAEAKNAELTKELDSLRVQFSDLQVSNC
ncbi:hypothetical protein Tco_1269203 [Tanacetum coccineum]